MSDTPDFEGFVKELIDNWFPDAMDIDGGEFQETAEKYGIIKSVPYDPDEHGSVEACEGDEIFVRNY